ncbi:MAG TPA: hypothetical protein VGC56_16495 [Allosphingosinicella sp.]|jgi:TPR repeat protein
MDYSPDEINRILAGHDVSAQKLVIDSIIKDAQAGDARANYMIAKWHSAGIYGFKKSKKEFDRHIQVAIKRLLPDAIYDYGVMLDTGQGKPDRAFGYYILAAVLGDADALDAVMKYFLYGHLVERDDFIVSSLQLRKDYLASQEAASS